MADMERIFEFLRFQRSVKMAGMQLMQDGRYTLTRNRSGGEVTDVTAQRVEMLQAQIAEIEAILTDAGEPLGRPNGMI